MIKGLGVVLLVVLCCLGELVAWLGASCALLGWRLARLVDKTWCDLVAGFRSAMDWLGF
jgi:hypothetical protein